MPESAKPLFPSSNTTAPPRRSEQQSSYRWKTRCSTPNSSLATKTAEKAKVIPPIVRKLIPRLASTFDGEVVATAHAIINALAADGFDLHDLARMADEAPLCRDRDREEGEYARCVRARLKEIVLEVWLDSWEREFVCSTLDRPNLDMLSVKQNAVICADPPPFAVRKSSRPDQASKTEN
jgi:hypothetical protein